MLYSNVNKTVLRIMTPMSMSGNFMLIVMNGALEVLTAV
jgi:hypothetical protein